MDVASISINLQDMHRNPSIPSMGSSVSTKYIYSHSQPPRQKVTMVRLISLPPTQLSREQGSLGHLKFSNLGLERWLSS